VLTEAGCNTVNLMLREDACIHDDKNQLGRLNEVNVVSRIGNEVVLHLEPEKTIKNIVLDNSVAKSGAMNEKKSETSGCAETHEPMQLANNTTNKAKNEEADKLAKKRESNETWRRIILKKEHVVSIGYCFGKLKKQA
jgi:hypothetical protein